MQRFKYTLAVVAITFLIISLLPDNVRSQSGRGRPRVPSREPAKPPPPPPKVPAASALVKQEQAGTTSRFLLKNGMTVIISEQHAAPIAAAVAYVKAGKIDEPEGASGVSSLLARIVMRGAPAANLRDMGALSGAEATADGTAYYLAVAPGKIKEALAIQADMLKSPPLAAEYVSREASLLAEGGDDREAMAFAAERAAGLALADSRFGRAFRSDQSPGPIAGDRIAEFYRSAYRPEKLIISVAGDVSTFNTLIEIQRLYGDFDQTVEQPAPPKPVENPAIEKATQPKTPSPKTPPQAADKAAPKPAAPATQASPEQAGAEQELAARLRYAAERGDTSQSIVTAAFRVPGLSSKESAALELIAAIMGKGRGSRLYRSLVEGQPVANRVNADYLAVAGEGLIVVQARAGAGLIDKAGSALFRELDRLRRELVSEGELARARTLLEKRFIDEIGTYRGRALWLARAEAASGSFRAALDYRKALSRVSAEDVQRAAARYFELANTSVFEYEPLNAPARTFDA
ncbi:MAG TPA: insulinase family protein, partial [Blastocatellia bacterium]|nr:insulinase family protein [Blastocatellia bacterium]